MRYTQVICASAVLFLATVTLGAQQAPDTAASTRQTPRPGGRQGEPPPFGVVAYPPRPPGDPASIERGKALYGANCTFCHGADARGGDGGGPNLLRSTVVLDDQHGELLAPLVQDGRGTMPKFQLAREQVGDIAEFLHSFTVSSRYEPSTIDILVGDPKKGEAYVMARCSSCHTTESLKAFAAKLADPKVLQQMWLMPGSGGRGAPPPIPPPPMTVTVTLPSGQKVQGTLNRMDDFVVSLTEADGTHRTFRTVGTSTKVEIHDPLAPHKAMLRIYTDTDIHDVTAYLVSLR